MNGARGAEIECLADALFHLSRLHSGARPGKARIPPQMRRGPIRAQFAPKVALARAPAGQSTQAEVRQTKHQAPRFRALVPASTFAAIA